MKLLVLDTRSGDLSSDLYILSQDKVEAEKISVGYVPEFFYDKIFKQIISVETEPESEKNDRARDWLKFYDSDSLKLIQQIETPARPMYIGYPGMSSRVKTSPSGRFVYFLESTSHPTDIAVYRIKIHRYDREKKQIQSSPLEIDSCMVEFGVVENTEEDLYFHLSCEFPSTVAFGNFNSHELEFLILEETPPRTDSLKETCGSWFSRSSNILHCISGEGTIHAVNVNLKETSELTRLDLTGERTIPLQQVYEAAGTLLIGVSKNLDERSLSLASEIWRVDAAGGETDGIIELPFPVMNFVAAPDCELIFGISPYEKAIVVVETKSGKILGVKENIGKSPAELILVPEH